MFDISVCSEMCDLNICLTIVSSLASKQSCFRWLVVACEQIFSIMFCAAGVVLLVMLLCKKAVVVFDAFLVSDQVNNSLYGLACNKSHQDYFHLYANHLVCHLTR